MYAIVMLCYMDYHFDSPCQHCNMAKQCRTDTFDWYAELDEVYDDEPWFPTREEDLAFYLQWKGGW